MVSSAAIELSLSERFKMLSRGPSSFSASGNNAAPKKMVLKPFKSQPKLPDNYEVETWAKLQAALVAVNTKVSTPHSKEELYRVRFFLLLISYSTLFVVLIIFAFMLLG